MSHIISFFHLGDTGDPGAAGPRGPSGVPGWMGGQGAPGLNSGGGGGGPITIANQQETKYYMNGNEVNDLLRGLTGGTGYTGKHTVIILLYSTQPYSWIRRKKMSMRLPESCSRGLRYFIESCHLVWHFVENSKIGWLVHPQNMSNHIDTVTSWIQVQICFFGIFAAITFDLDLYHWCVIIGCVNLVNSSQVNSFQTKSWSNWSNWSKRRLTLVKGIYSFRYFLHPMHILNLLMHVGWGPYLPPGNHSDILFMNYVLPF